MEGNVRDMKEGRKILKLAEFFAHQTQESPANTGNKESRLH